MRFNLFWVVTPYDLTDVHQNCYFEDAGSMLRQHIFTSVRHHIAEGRNFGSPRKVVILPLVWIKVEYKLDNMHIK
jgi:hypothetical protein